MKGVETLFDVTRAVAAAKPYVRGLSPGLAAMNAAAFSALAVVFGILSWYFDFDATLSFISPFSDSLVGTLPATFVAIIPLFGLLITLSPSIIQLFLPAIAQIKLVALALYATVIFDALTDYPRVVSFLAFYKPTTGFVEYWLWKAAHPIFLLFASVGFEFLLVLCLSVMIMCVARAFASVGMVRGA